MADNTNEKLLSLVEDNKASREKVIQTASRLYALKEEAPSLVHQLGSLHNLPIEITNTLENLEKLGTPQKATSKETSLLSSIPKDKQQAVASTLGHTVLGEFPLSDSVNYYVNAFADAVMLGAIPVVGPVFAGIKVFRAIRQKKKFEESGQEETTVVKKSTNVFNDAIMKMEFLLENSEVQVSEITDEIMGLTETTKNYDMLSKKQKKDLVEVIDKLSTLIEELKQKIEV